MTHRPPLSERPPPSIIYEADDGDRRVSPRARLRSRISRTEGEPAYGDEEDLRRPGDAFRPLPGHPVTGRPGAPLIAEERDAAEIPERGRTERPAVSRLPSTTSAVPVPARRISPMLSDVDYEDEDRRPRRRRTPIEAENRLAEIARSAQQAEDRRESHFRHHEEDRDRIFADNEARRDEESRHRRDEIYRDLEDRIDDRLGRVRSETHTLAGDRPLRSERPERTASIHESMYTAAQDAASRHAADIMETVRMEREELAREREAAAAERERHQAELDAERARHRQEWEADRAREREECESRIRALEETNARLLAQNDSLLAQIESERQGNLTEEAENRERARQEALERDEAVREQLGDITNLVQDQRDECARKKELMDERWTDKLRRREDKDEKLQSLYDMVTRLVEDREAEKARADEERQAAEGKPGRLFYETQIADQN